MTDLDTRHPPMPAPPPSLSPPSLSPPSLSPPSLSPGGRTAVRSGLVIAAVLVLLGSLGGLTAAAVGVGGTRVFAEQQTLPANLRSITVDTGALPVAVRITADPEVREPRVEMRLVSATRVDDDIFDIESGPDTRITMRGERREWLEWARGGELTVVLPPEIGRRMTLTTNQQRGVLMVDADLDRLIARTANGAVILGGAAGTVDVRVEDGTVAAHDPILVRESFSANVLDGDIAVDFRDIAPRTVDATAVDGDVVLGLPGNGPYLVNASSGDVDNSTVIRVPQTSNPAEAESVITARSSNGDVIVDGQR